MRKKKAFSFLAGFLAIFLVLAGCSSDSEKTSSDGKKVIKFMHLWPEGSSKQHHEIVKNIVADYEKDHKDVKVELEVLSNEQYKDKIKVLSASNELPDVGMTWSAGYLQPYVEGKKFAPLDDLLEGDLKDKFVAGTAEAYQIDGKTYGLPLELNIASIYYNKKIFKDNGIEVPKTYEDLIKAAETLDKNGVEPIALGNKDKWTGSLWYMYLADRIGGTEALKGAIDRSGTFEDPALVSAAEKVQDLVDANGFVNGFNGLSDEEAKSMFMNSQAAMYLIATWDLPNYTTNPDVPQEFKDQVGFFDFPTVEGKGDMNSYVGGPGVGLFVSEDSKVKEEAKDFVSFFVQQWGEKSVTDAGVIPATKIDAGKLDLPQMYVDVLEKLNKATNITLYADVQLSSDAAQVHLDQIQALFGKETTPEKFAKAHEDALSAK